METKAITIIKRDGASEAFSIDKIKRAIEKAYRAGNISDEATINQISERVMQSITTEEVTVEQVQDLVEMELMRVNPDIAKRYIIYREWRTKERDKRTSMKHVMDGIVSVEKNDINLSNANMSSHTPAGQMMTFASEVTKDYAYKYLVGVRYARAHKNGDIHIHDLDYYPTKTTTCTQYDLDDIFSRGFRTKNGTVRPPQSIFSYATLATIIFQTNQNEQHGGQSIPAFDHFMAAGVIKSFRKHLIDGIAFLMELKGCEKVLDLKEPFAQAITTIAQNDIQSNAVMKILQEEGVEITTDELHKLWAHSHESTRKDTHQAMEGLIHNLNTMHSRGGNQVVFSSINYGTDTSPEGRMVIRELLASTVKGLGTGEVPVFPIQIFKVKEGISYSEADYNKAMENIEDALQPYFQADTRDPSLRRALTEQYVTDYTALLADLGANIAPSCSPVLPGNRIDLADGFCQSPE